MPRRRCGFWIADRLTWRRCGKRSPPSSRMAVVLPASSGGSVSSSRKRRRGRIAWKINAAILEVIELTHSEAMKNGVSVKTELAQGLPLIHGDRVQLQQVILNLVINAIEAMSSMREGAREL